MRVSVSLHCAQPPDDGNQRDHEARYGGYNRRFADLIIQPITGLGVCDIVNLDFPTVQTDPEIFTHWSLGVCFAPEGFGGCTIIVGQLSAPLSCPVGEAPRLNMACAIVDPRRLRALGLIRKIEGCWVELSEKELRAQPLSLLVN